MIDNLRDEIRQRIDTLSDEAERLRAALSALGGPSASDGQTTGVHHAVTAVPVEADATACCGIEPEQRE